MGFVIYILLLIFDYFLIMLFTDTASQERFWSENFRNVNESLFRGELISSLSDMISQIEILYIVVKTGLNSIQSIVIVCLLLSEIRLI